MTWAISAGKDDPGPFGRRSSSWPASGWTRAYCARSLVNRRRSEYFLNRSSVYRASPPAILIFLIVTGPHKSEAVSPHDAEYKCG